MGISLCHLWAAVSQKFLQSVQINFTTAARQDVERRNSFSTPFKHLLRQHDISCFADAEAAEQHKANRQFAAELTEFGPHDICRSTQQTVADVSEKETYSGDYLFDVTWFDEGPTMHEQAAYIRSFVDYFNCPTLMESAEYLQGLRSLLSEYDTCHAEPSWHAWEVGSQQVSASDYAR